MGLGHEKLDVYRLSMGHVAWVFEKTEGLQGVHRGAREQWLRASQSIPFTIRDCDPDSDFDLERKSPRRSAAGRA